MTLLQAAEAGKRLAQLRRDERQVQRDLKEVRVGSAAYAQLAQQARNLHQQIEQLEHALRD
jgi:DNA repair exonuclease SbcCD ATPase subunit